jgi:nucleotide-binding universal stress UspA family protein
MSMLRSILLATDFRPASLEAIRVAEQLASGFGSRITLYHVFYPLYASPSLLQQQRELASWQLQQLAQQLITKGVSVAESMVAAGHPATMIVRKAQEIDADLILIGAGKWLGQEPFTLGPVAEAVLHHAAQPVLAVRPGRPTVTFRKILCPVDHSHVSERGLRTAIGLARAFDGTVHVLSVVPEMSWLPAALETGQLAGAIAEHEHQWQAEFKQFLMGVDFAEVPWTEETRRGAAHEEIIAAVKEHQCDVIVMGSTGRTGLARLLLGSVTRRVVQQLPCSLLTVKEEEPLGPDFEEDLQHMNFLLAEGRELLAAKSYPLALVKFRQVLAFNPYQAAALEGLAEVHQQLGQVDKAERYRQRARLLQPQARGGKRARSAAR